MTTTAGILTIMELLADGTKHTFAFGVAKTEVVIPATFGLFLAKHPYKETDSINYLPRPRIFWGGA